MKNTLENKAKFFAQYWGQKVKRYNNKSPLIELDFVDFIELKESDHIELIPLSSISDEDSLHIAKVDVWRWQEHTAQRGRTLVEREKDLKELSPESTDYLRSRGYAFPWMGLSVKELVNRGWVKLKEASHG